MLKKLSFLLIGLLFFASSVYAEDLSTRLRTSSAVYKDSYYDVPFLDSKANFFDGYFIARISAKDNYLFVLGTKPDVYKLFDQKKPHDLKEDGYSFLDIIDLRNSETVFSSGYLFKDFNLSTPGDIVVRDKYLTISDRYAFVGFLGTTAPLATKIYDISNLPKVVDKGFIDIFPSAVSKNKALVINELPRAKARGFSGKKAEMPSLRFGRPFIPEFKNSGFSGRVYKKGISIYDIKDVTNPVLKGKYLKAGISQIKIEGNRAYIEYYNAAKKKTFLEILKIKNFSLKKIGKSYLLPLSSAIYFQSLPINFYVRNKFVYILDSVQGTFVLDVSNPNNIHKTSEIEGVASNSSIISDNYAFIINSPTIYDDRLTVLDISNPYNISIALRILHLDIHALYVEGVAASGNYLILKTVYFVGPYEGPKGDDLVVFEIPSFTVKLNKFNSNVEIKKSPKVILTWQTGSEDGAKEFYIMRKNKNINKKIGFINAKVTDLQGASYKIVDNTVTNGKTYKYQLFYKDTDGGDHLLKVISVRVN